MVLLKQSANKIQITFLLTMATIPPTTASVGFPASLDGVVASRTAPVFRISTANLTTAGDAVYPNAIRDDTDNLFRGEGQPTCEQKGRPIYFLFDDPVPSARVIDFTASDALARKLFVCNKILVNKQETNPLQVRIPTLSQFVNAGYKLGDSGVWYLGVNDTSGAGTQQFQIVPDGTHLTWGELNHTTASTGVHRATCIIAWDIDLDVTDPDSMIVNIIPAWTGQT